MESHLNLVSDPKSQQISTKNVSITKPKAETENLNTPTSDENKIPAADSPPPAPRKRRCVGRHCVRKLEFSGEQRITVSVADQAVKDFFISSTSAASAGSVDQIKGFKRKASLAFDCLNSSNNVAFAQQIV